MSTPAERSAFSKALYEENLAKVTLQLTVPECAVMARGLDALLTLARMDRDNGLPMDGILQDAAEIAASLQLMLNDRLAAKQRQSPHPGGITSTPT